MAGKGKPKTGGNKKGYKQEKRIQWDEMGTFITMEGTDKAMRILATLQGKEYLEWYAKLLSYFKPQLARTENKHEGNINIIEKVLVPVKE